MCTPAVLNRDRYLHSDKYYSFTCTNIFIVYVLYCVWKGVKIQWGLTTLNQLKMYWLLPALRVCARIRLVIIQINISYEHECAYAFRHSTHTYTLTHTQTRSLRIIWQARICTWHYDYVILQLHVAGDANAVGRGGKLCVHCHQNNTDISLNIARAERIADVRVCIGMRRG